MYYILCNSYTYNTCVVFRCITHVVHTHVIHVWYFRCITHVVHTPVIHVWYFRCITHVIHTPVIHVWCFRCITHVIHTPVIHVSNTDVRTTHIINVQLITPYMYYRYDTTGLAPQWFDCTLYSVRILSNLG